jgi:peroxiredoxin
MNVGPAAHLRPWRPIPCTILPMATPERHKLLDIGAVAPDFRLPRLEGGEITLQEIIAAGPALLAFFKISCPVCQMTLPFLDRIQSPDRLPVYAISQNDAADTRAFQRRFTTALPTLLDPENAGFPVSNAFGISMVPTLFLIEPGGAISRVLEGWSKSEVAQLGVLAGVNPFSPGEPVPEWKAG